MARGPGQGRLPLSSVRSRLEDRQLWLRSVPPTNWAESLSPFCQAGAFDGRPTCRAPTSPRRRANLDCGHSVPSMFCGLLKGHAAAPCEIPAAAALLFPSPCHSGTPRTIAIEKRERSEGLGMQSRLGISSCFAAARPQSPESRRAPPGPEGGRFFELSTRAQALPLPWPPEAARRRGGEANRGEATHPRFSVIFARQGLLQGFLHCRSKALVLGESDQRRSAHCHCC